MESKIAETLPPAETLEGTLEARPASTETLGHTLASSSTLETLESQSPSSENLGDQSMSTSASTSSLALMVCDEPSPSNTTEWASSSWSSSVKSEPFSASNVSLAWPSFVNSREFGFLHYFRETKPSMIGPGLENLGNTCFMNAVLQCFTHTVPLVQGLRSSNHPNPCDRALESFCAVCALSQHIEFSLANSEYVISPSKLVDNLTYFSSSFQRFEQEDAHEFLQCLLDRLDSCSLEPKAPSQDTFVKQIFGGSLKSQLRCCNCGHDSITIEPLIDLSLEIDDAETLSSALKSFTKVEKIDEQETKFVCENCMGEVAVEKQLTLDKVPSVAALHLKRFKNDGSYVQKIDKYVEYPLQLDLQPYTSSTQDNNEEQMDLKYELYGIVVHNGYSSCSGHYYCFVRSSPDTWYKLDDARVIRVREEFVLSQQAYILFYARQGTPWFSSLMEKQKQCLDTKSARTSPKSVLDGVDRTCTPSPCRPGTCITEVNEVRNDQERICSSSPCGPATLFSSGVKNCSDEMHEADGNVHEMCNPVPPRASGSSSQIYETSSNTDGLHNTSPPGNHNNIEIVKTKSFGDVHPQASPPRSPSPDVYAREEPAEASYNIPRDHLLLEKQLPCKRQLNRALEDSKRKEAFRLVKRMPTSRRMAYMVAMTGSGDDSNKKRKRRMGVTCRNNGLVDGETASVQNM